MPRKRAEIKHIPASVASLISTVQLAQAANTRAAYDKDLLRFVGANGEIPATPEEVAAYLVAHRDLKISTLRRWASGISFAHVSANLPDPCASRLVKDTLKGLSKSETKDVRRARPAIVKEVRIMVDRQPASLRGIRNRAILLVGFCGALRRSEIRALEVRDVAFDTDCMRLRIRSSKTDQEARGATVTVMKAKQARYCAIDALKFWIQTAGIRSGSLFRPISKSGAIAADALSGYSISQVVKEAADLAGLDSTTYSGHSLRAGLITSAMVAGKPRHKVKGQSRHKSDAAFDIYIRDLENKTDNASDLF